MKSADGKCGQVNIEGNLDYEAFRLKKGDPSVKAASAAIVRQGGTPELTIANGGLDANWLTARGIPTVSLGCGKHCIHTANEWLDLTEFHQARRIALHLATEAE